MSVSSRISTADAAFSAVKNFYFASRYSQRRLEPEKLVEQMLRQRCDRAGKAYRL